MAADLIAGTMAGFAICAVGHPFDTLKVLLQTQPERYKSMMAAGRETVAKFGLGGLYRGVASPLIGSGFYNAVQFAVFGAVRRVATEDGRKDTLNRIAAAAAFTGIFVAMVEGVSPAGVEASSGGGDQRVWKRRHAPPQQRISTWGGGRTPPLLRAAPGPVQVPDAS